MIVIAERPDGKLVCSWQAGGEFVRLFYPSTLVVVSHTEGVETIVDNPLPEPKGREGIHRGQLSAVLQADGSIYVVCGHCGKSGLDLEGTCFAEDDGPAGDTNPYSFAIERGPAK